MPVEFSKQNVDETLWSKPSWFHRLRWRATVSFVAVGVLAWFVTNVTLSVFSYAALRQTFDPAQFTARSQPIANAAAVYFENQNNELTNLTSWLHRQREQIIADRLKTARYLPNPEMSFEPEGNDSVVLIAVGTRGEILSATQDIGRNRNFADYSKLNDGEKSLLRAVLSGERDPNKLMLHSADKSYSLALPVWNRENRLIGALFIRELLPFASESIFAAVLDEFFDEINPVILYLILFGFLFGFPVAHHLTRRLDKIAFAARSWSKGNFSPRIVDNWKDELQFLSRQLNQMADDLSIVFKLRQELAASEERNRIALDLHDSVKQQVFGLMMQIGAARLILAKNGVNSHQRLKTKLEETEAMTRRVQDELVGILENSQSVESGETLLEKIRFYAEDWSQQSGIKAKTIFDERLSLPEFIGTYSLFRIIQEATTNIARHSGAQNVRIALQLENQEMLRMTIDDDGCGFAVADVEKGFGMSNMRERAEKLPSGWFVLKSRIGHGTSIEVGCRLQVRGYSKNVKDNGFID